MSSVSLVDGHIDYTEKNINMRDKEIIKDLENKVKRLKVFKSYFDELYGKGLEFANWHLNGDLEPFDNFYESAIQEMADGDKLT